MTRAITLFLVLLLAIAASPLESAQTVTSPKEETDAQKALAVEWMTAGREVKPYGWKACLRALDVLTQTAARYREAADILTAGRPATLPPTNPYTLTNADLVKNLGDWVEGASRLCVAKPMPCSCANNLGAALESTKEVINDFYQTDKQGLIAKVDANFQGKNPQRAFYELLRYEGEVLEEAERNAPKDLYDYQSGCDAKGAARSVRIKLEDIRICYASTDKDPKKDYRKKVSDYVSSLFRPPTKTK
jgi:hypothetical protein